MATKTDILAHSQTVILPFYYLKSLQKFSTFPAQQDPEYVMASTQMICHPEESYRKKWGYTQSW